MASASSSPWLAMLQTAIFDGDIDGAIAKAKKQMKQIQCN
jgi:multiple sugar transport system substrate-binding protein